MIEKFLVERSRKYVGVHGIEDIHIVASDYNPVLYHLQYKSKDFTHTEQLDIMDVMWGSELNDTLVDKNLELFFDNYVLSQYKHSL